MLLQDAIHAVEATYAERGIVIPATSVLLHLLNEAARFNNSARDLIPLATNAQTDEDAMAVGGRLLEVVRLGNALALHTKHRTPKITETLETLVAFQHQNAEHENQFRETEYELHAASEFVGCGQRVAFVDTARPSRYRQRVEFMLGGKWPVECKRPRSSAKIISNLRAAVGKLDERTQPGIVCIALEEALPNPKFYREALNVEEAREVVSQEFNTWWEHNSNKMLETIRGTHARFVIVNYTALTYAHDTGNVMLPSLRLGVAQDGEWIQCDVCCECVRRLAKDRGLMTGQWVE